MTVSVVIPTYNGAAFLAETYKSVIGQTHSDLEIVFSDDGSIDDTMSIVSSFDDPRVSIVDDRSHVGPQENWNRGMFHAKGEFVKILAQDDLLYPRNLEVSVAALEHEPLASFAAVKRDVIGADGSVLVRDRGLSRLCGTSTLQVASRKVVRSGANQFGEGSAVLFRKAAADAAGGFDASLPYAIDIDFWLRLLTWGPVVGICETLSAFRVSSQAWSNSLASAQGRQFAALIERTAMDSSREITPGDVLSGNVRAAANAYLRRLFYLRYRSRL